MLINCKDSIIQSDLLLDIDLSKTKSWDLNENLSAFSMNKWDGSVVDKIKMCDYGLTMFDIGESINMNETKIINYNNKFNLSPIKYNVLTGTTGNSFSGVTTIIPEISGVTGNTVGNYFSLNGGYLNNYFKLQDENYQVLPIRYNNGFTVETYIQIFNDSNGIFYYMGTRSEDKYNLHFEGEVSSHEEEETITVRSGNMGEAQTTTKTNIVYEGVKTSKDNLLYSLKNDTERKNAFNDFANAYNDILVQPEQKDNISNNVIAFYITNNKELGYKYVDENGLINSETSLNKVSFTGSTSGWTTISISFKPYNIINNYEESQALCYERRLGDLTFYVNGKKFWKISDFVEFYFKPIINDNEKTIGVPYNISWGGGSFGLNNSYHYNINENYIYSGETNNYVNTNYSIVNNDDSCVNDVILSANNNEFVDENNNEINVLEFSHTGSTGTTCSKYYYEYLQPIEIYPNRNYTISVDISKFDVFQLYTNYEISIEPYGSDDLIVVDYNNVTQHYVNEWDNANITFSVSNKCEKQIIYVGVQIKADRILNDEFKIFFNDFKIVGLDILDIDESKNNLTIGNNFNDSYFGSIQKLRLYNKPLNSREVLNNSIVDNNDNVNKKGGRLIYV